MNPAEDVHLDVPKGPKGHKPRRPFSPEELTILFGSPLFIGCKGVRRRFEPGTLVVKDGHYWIPLLGFYTGARLGELVQLHLDDVFEGDPIPHISITEAGSGPPDSDDHKSVKSEAGVRRVPLHPELLQLGFGEFMARRRREKRPSRRVFWSIGLGADQQASTVFSKWFGRLLDRRGLSDPALVFHSFRHSAENSFRDALLPRYVIGRIIGHSDGATSAGYGSGVSLETAYDAVRAMKLRIDVRAVLGHSQGLPA